MAINAFQAALFGLFACLASLPGMGGTTIGNYTLGRPLVAGLIVGIIMGDMQTGILVGAAIQVVYIALVTPGGTVSADVRAVSYIGIPLAILAIKNSGIDPASAEAAGMAASLGAAVGTLGTVLFYGTATINLVWQGMGWKWLNNVLPWIGHIVCSFLPTFIITMGGTAMVDLMKTYMPMDGIAMKTLFTVGSLLPTVGIAILLKQVISKPTDFLTFFFGFTLSAVMGCNLIAAAGIGCFFALINYEIASLKIDLANAPKAAIASGSDDEEEEDI